MQSDVSIDYKRIENNILLKNFCESESFDCGIIVTPDNCHFEQISILFSLNIHVLCVKPLVNNILENIQLIKLQEEKKLLGVVEFHKRYDEANLFTKKILNSDKIGKILYYSVEYSQRISIPLESFRSWVEYTNIFQYLGVHYVDLFYFFTGYKPIRLCAYGTFGRLKSEGINTYDSIHVNIIWIDRDNSECITVFNTNWIDPNCTSAMSDQKYKIVGTKGRIENNHKNRGIELVSDTENIEHPNPYFSEYLYDSDGNNEFNGYGYKSISQFIKDVSNIKVGKINIEFLKNKRPDFSEALISTSIIEKVNISLKNNNQWVSIIE